MTESAASGALERGGASILGAVLVGGASRRMGRDKSRLELAGRTLAERAAGVLETAVGEAVLVAREPEAWPGAKHRVVADRFPGGGPLAAIHAALAAAGGRPVFALACDLPHVVPELVRHLVERAGPMSPEEARVLLPRVGLEVQPLCGLYAPGCLRPLGEFLAGGGRRVFDFLGRVRAAEVEIGPERPFYRADLLDNLNTPADLERLLVAAGEA